MAYTDVYYGINFRQHPELYVIGRGEQGVLIAEPYKSEILPYWRFATPVLARQSAGAILGLFETYKQQSDFVGMDMARKFLQMGWTRSRRYANHRDGRKYDANGKVRVQEHDAEISPKAESARIFKCYYDQIRQDDTYLALKKQHQQRRLTERQRTQ